MGWGSHLFTHWVGCLADVIIAFGCLVRHLPPVVALLCHRRLWMPCWAYVAGKNPAGPTTSWDFSLGRRRLGMLCCAISALENLFWTAAACGYPVLFLFGAILWPLLSPWSCSETRLDIRSLGGLLGRRHLGGLPGTRNAGDSVGHGADIRPFPVCSRSEAFFWAGRGRGLAAPGGLLSPSGGQRRGV